METKAKTLLIVDDEVELREILAFAFERKGYLVFQAGNAVEAMELVRKNNISVIISDIRMPGGDGIQLLEEVKKYDPNIPTMLFITGFADITFEEAYDRGCDAIFSKPFDTKVLMAAVEKMLQDQQDQWKVKRAARESTLFEINLKFDTFSQAQKAHVINVGRGGFFVGMTENFPKVDDLISFQMTVGQGVLTTIEGEGKVKWVRREALGDLPSGCGVEFVSLEEKSRSKLFEFINFLRTKQYIPKR